MLSFETFPNNVRKTFKTYDRRQIYWGITVTCNLHMFTHISFLMAFRDGESFKAVDGSSLKPLVRFFSGDIY